MSYLKLNSSAVRENYVLVLQAGHVDEAMIGRGEDADVRVFGRDVSRAHARIFWDPGAASWFIEDLGSMNGTKILRDDLSSVVEVTKELPVQLRAGDCIQLAAHPQFEVSIGVS